MTEALKGNRPVFIGNPVFNDEESLPRKLTTARELIARIRDRIPGVSSWRTHSLMEIERQVSNESSGKYIGQVLDVLLEQYDGRSDVYIGRSQYDAPVIDGEGVL